MKSLLVFDFLALVCLTSDETVCYSQNKICETIVLRDTIRIKSTTEKEGLNTKKNRKEMKTFSLLCSLWKLLWMSVVWFFIVPVWLLLMFDLDFDFEVVRVVCSFVRLEDVFEIFWESELEIEEGASIRILSELRLECVREEEFEMRGDSVSSIHSKSSSTRVISVALLCRDWSLSCRVWWWSWLWCCCTVEFKVLQFDRNGRGERISSSSSWSITMMLSFDLVKSTEIGSVLRTFSDWTFCVSSSIVQILWWSAQVLLNEDWLLSPIDGEFVTTSHSSERGASEVWLELFWSSCKWTSLEVKTWEKDRIWSEWDNIKIDRWYWDVPVQWVHQKYD